MLGAKATWRGAVIAVLHPGTKTLLSVEKYMLINFPGEKCQLYASGREKHEQQGVLEINQV